MVEKKVFVLSQAYTTFFTPCKGTNLPRRACCIQLAGLINCTSTNRTMRKKPSSTSSWQSLFAIIRQKIWQYNLWQLCRRVKKKVVFPKRLVSRRP